MRGFTGSESPKPVQDVRKWLTGPDVERIHRFRFTKGLTGPVQDVSKWLTGPDVERIHRFQFPKGLTGPVQDVSGWLTGPDFLKIGRRIRRKGEEFVDEEREDGKSNSPEKELKLLKAG